MIRELALVLVLSVATDLRASELVKVPAKVIAAAEKEAKKYKVIKELDKMTNIVIADTTMRLRPGKFEISKNKKDYKLNINTNLKDELKLKFTLSF